VNIAMAEPSLTFEVHQVGTGIVRRRTLGWDEINRRIRIPTCALMQKMSGGRPNSVS
jgi:hypothetical protein